MKNNSKKLLAAVIAMIMVLSMAVPALATGETEGTKTGTQVQITKKLNIGQGITVPTETFYFQFTNITAKEAEMLGVKGQYIDPDATQASANYPVLPRASVIYNESKRDKDGTDEELTFMSNVIDLSDSTITWSVPGLYIYSVTEVAGSNQNMTYDQAKYFLYVYVKNVENGTAVDFVNVYGKKDNDEWAKIDGAPTDIEEPGTTGHDDGSRDYAGNEFVFTNSYNTLVSEHPTNPNPADSDDKELEKNPKAFKLTKDVQGIYANQFYGFDFKVVVHLPATNSGYTPITCRVNGYTLNQLLNTDTYDESRDHAYDIEPDVEYPVFLRHGTSFSIDTLPAGSTVEVKEEPSNMHYVPSYLGKWGGDIDVERRGSANKGEGLTADLIVVGENGAYIQYTNTLNNSDVTTTGIVISNLPYILMVVIAVAGIGFYMVSKKRRNG